MLPIHSDTSDVNVDSMKTDLRLSVKVYHQPYWRVGNLNKHGNTMQRDVKTVKEVVVFNSCAAEMRSAAQQPI